MADINRAVRIQATINTPGWRDIVTIIDASILEAQEEVLGLMLRTPEKLTGKAAIRIAAKARALKDFMETIEDEVKILSPNRKAGKIDVSDGLTA